MPLGDPGGDAFLVHFSVLRINLAAVLKKNVILKVCGRFHVFLCFHPYGSTVYIKIFWQASGPACGAITLTLATFLHFQK